MRHLLPASGLEENPSPQFETIIKDRFLKALPAKVAACSGNWFYTDLIGLAKCATEYIKANKRYTEGSTSSNNLKAPRLTAFLIDLIILNLVASHSVISTKTQKQVIQQHQETRDFKAETILIHAPEVIFVTFTENFVKWQLNVKDLSANFLTLAYISIGR